MAAVATVPFTQFVATAQEPPDVGQSWAKIGAPPLNVAALPQVNRYTFTSQEYPDLGSARTWAGVWPASVAAPPQVQHTYTVQEYPDLGYARTWAGVPPNVATPPQIAHVVTFQEYPDHPLPPQFPRFQVQVTVTPVPPGNTQVTTSQEFPFHPFAMTLGAPGVFGNGPAPPQTGTAEWLVRARRRGKR